MPVINGSDTCILAIQSPRIIRTICLKGPGIKSPLYSTVSRSESLQHTENSSSIPDDRYTATLLSLGFPK